MAYELARMPLKGLIMPPYGLMRPRNPTSILLKRQHGYKLNEMMRSGARTRGQGHGFWLEGLGFLDLRRFPFAFERFSNYLTVGGPSNMVG